MAYQFQDSFLEKTNIYHLRVETVTLKQSYFRHSHTFSEIVVVLSGTAEHVIGDQTYRIGAGDVFVIDSAAEHAFGQVQELVIINFSYHAEDFLLDRADLRLLPGFEPLFIVAPSLRDKKADVGMLHLGSSELDFVRNLAEMIVRQSKERAEGFEPVVKLLFQTVAAYLATKYVQMNAAASQNLSLLSAAFHYMEEHFAEEITVSGLAASLSVSSRQLERLFRHYCKETPMEHLTELRMSRALALLTYSNETVSLISGRCGYPDASYFSRQFKARYQVSPKRYRELLSAGGLSSL